MTLSSDPSLSEVESISDSDWLDISSHASEDNESLGDLESDVGDVLSRPHSRQSFGSSASSDGRGVDVWEGMIDNTDDEALLEGVDDPPPEPTNDIQGTLRPRSLTHRRLVAEELREREALEQSMVSTLSTSRQSSLSSSASLPTSASRSRDLRLSFPDPLTSSRDELNRSYDNVEPEDATPRPPLPSEQSICVSEEAIASDTVVSENVILPVVPKVRETRSLADLDIVIYGNDSANKSRVVNILLEKLAEGSGRFLSWRESLTMPQDVLYTLDTKGRHPMSSLTVSVISRQDSFIPPGAEERFNANDRPSLAVVHLPSSRQSFSESLHTLFLPITESLSTNGVGTNQADAEKQWRSLAIPTSQLLLWHVDSPSPVMNESEVNALDPTDVVLGFEPLLPRKRRLLNAIRDQIASTPAMTFLAILSIVLGYIVSLSSPVSISSDKEAVSNVIKILANASSHMTLVSVPMPSPSPVPLESAAALASMPPSSLSTLAPTFELRPAAILTLGSEPRAKTPSPPTSLRHTPRCSSSSSSSHSLSLTTTKALSVLPPTVKSLSTTSSLSSSRPSPSSGTFNALLSTSLQDFLSVKVISDALYAEIKELTDALDELLRLITSQASSSLSLTLSVADGLRDHVRRGNRRALERARRMRQRGARVLRDARGHAWSRFERAQRRAKSIQAHFNEAVTVVGRLQNLWEDGVAERKRRLELHREKRAAHDRIREERRARVVTST